MRPLVYWARAEQVRFRPTHKSDETIEGSLTLPDGRRVPFRYHRRDLTLDVGAPGDRHHPLEGGWQLDEYGVPTPRDATGEEGKP
jgi:hypothetical protein